MNWITIAIASIISFSIHYFYSFSLFVNLYCAQYVWNGTKFNLLFWY